MGPKLMKLLFKSKVLCGFIIFGILSVSLASAPEPKLGNFNNVSFRLGYSDKLYSTIKDICEAELKKDKNLKINCGIKASEVFGKMRKKMESDFYTTFSKPEEQAYIAKLFAHDLMVRLYDFKIDFIQNESNRAKMLTDLKAK